MGLCVYVGQSEAEQRVYANELFARLSPFAQSIMERRWLGYSWRKIAAHLDMDHTAVRRAYFRELEALRRALSQPGDFFR
jgi:DNA-directed RNA polymerase specialized sigma24 family protein